MVTKIILIHDDPVDVVVLDWQMLNRKKLYETANYYKSQGYLVLVEKILHRRDGSGYRVVQFGSNELQRFYFKLKGEADGKN